MEEVPWSGNKTSVDDLPLEVLSEVASHLDFVDILSLQQTSKRLRESTEVRAIWLALTKEYSARHFQLYRPGSLDDISTDELRAWIRKRLIVDQIWKAPHAVPHIRTLPQHCNPSEFVFKLVPGGRWLLILQKDGSVWYYDLNSAEPEQLPLIPPTNALDGPKSLGKLAVYVDQGVSRVDFKLVVYRIEFEDDGGRRGGLHIWQIKLEDAKLLAADRLRSIPCGYGDIQAVTLGPQLVACALYGSFGPSWIEVTWWQQCSGTRVLRSRFSKSDEVVESMDLIGDGRIFYLSKCPAVARLYTLPEPEYTNDFGLDGLRDRGYTWSRSLGYGIRSPMCYDGTAYRFVMSGKAATSGWTIPASGGNRPSMILISTFPNWWRICIPGICKAYAEGYDEGGTGARVGYSWDDEGGPPETNYSNEGQKAIVHPALSPTLDEEVGRVVYLSNRDITVVDFLHQFDETS